MSFPEIDHPNQVSNERWIWLSLSSGKGMILAKVCNLAIAKHTSQSHITY